MAVLRTFVATLFYKYEVVIKCISEEASWRFNDKFVVLFDVLGLRVIEHTIRLFPLPGLILELDEVHSQNLMIICNITHIDCHFGTNSLYYISTMNKKNIDKIANQPNYNHQLFTLAIATAQACQQLANKTQALPPDHRQQLGDKPKLLEAALKNAISVMGKFADIQKAPLASPMDHSL